MSSIALLLPPGSNIIEICELTYTSITMMMLWIHITAFRYFLKCYKNQSAYQVGYLDGKIDSSDFAI
jgi:hypothetical protein